jgi:hypothetical protein
MNLPHAGDTGTLAWPSAAFQHFGENPRDDYLETLLLWRRMWRNENPDSRPRDVVDFQRALKHAQRASERAIAELRRQLAAIKHLPDDARMPVAHHRELLRVTISNEQIWAATLLQVEGFVERHADLRRRYEVLDELVDQLMSLASAPHKAGLGQRILRAIEEATGRVGVALYDR